MAKVGRPPIPPERVEELKELYLSLLRIGTPERKIDAVKGMVNWETRRAWLADAEFSARRLQAQGFGVEHELMAHQERLEKVFEMGLDEAANKPLVDCLKEMGAHARWRASKLNRKVYGEKTALVGDPDEPVHIVPMSLADLIQRQDGKTKTVK